MLFGVLFSYRNIQATRRAADPDGISGEEYPIGVWEEGGGGKAEAYRGVDEQEPEIWLCESIWQSLRSSCALNIPFIPPVFLLTRPLT